MGFSFPSPREVKAHIEELEREVRKSKEIELPPLITSLIVATNVVVFIGTFSSGNPENILKTYGFTPVHLIRFGHLHSLLTHMFLHADLFHISINMLIFLSFAPLCERKMGKRRFLLFYLICGVLAAVFYFLFNLFSAVPVVGASGAIFGVLAAFVVFYPERNIFIQIVVVPVKVPAIIAIPFVFVIETVFAFVGLHPNIAHLVHVGGFIAGICVLGLMYPKLTEEFVNLILDALIPYPVQSTPESRQHSDKPSCEVKNTTRRLTM